MPNREAVRCPWCGMPMTLCVDAYSDGTITGAYYECIACKADSPYIEDADDIKAAAYAAAMRRYVEANRVLTWEEFLALPNKMLACREYRGDERYSPCHMWEGYGKTWRAWLRRPTDAERETVPWECKNA